MVELQSDSTPPGALPLALIVGDAPRGSGWLRYLLEANGYGALTLNSGREALAIARGAPIDVIAIDMQLSDMDGVTLCRLLRDDMRVSAATPLLLVSPSPLLGVARLEGLRAGAWDCVDPATHPEDLLLRVQAFVRGRRESERQRGAGLVDPPSGLYNRQGLARSIGAAAAHAGQGSPPLRFRAGYESVANVGYEPMEPMELLARATAALRTGRPEPGLDWLRRYEPTATA